MRDDKRLQRIAYELGLCAVAFSRTKSVSFDDEAGSWVVIHDFPLPKGYNYATTDVLILLPPNYPQTPPDWFYVDYNLRLADGREPQHVFNDMEFGMVHDPNRRDHREMPPQMMGWTACCLHIREWKPKTNPTEGHSLLSVCQLIAKAFERWKR